MYLNLIQLAESFGVDEPVVTGWVRDEGLPHIHDRGRMLFDRAQVVAWAARRGLAVKAGFLALEGSQLHGGRRLEPLLRTGGIWRGIGSADVFGVLEKVIQGLPGATAAIRQFLGQRLRSPQGVTWAPVGEGLALPHLRAPVALGPESGTFALLLLKEAWTVSEPMPDNVSITRMLFFIAPSPRAHLELLGQLSTALTHGALRQLIYDAASDEEIFAELAAIENGGRKEGAAS